MSTHRALHITAREHALERGLLRRGRRLRHHRVHRTEASRDLGHGVVVGPALERRVGVLRKGGTCGGVGRVGAVEWGWGYHGGLQVVERAVDGRRHFGRLGPVSGRRVGVEWGAREGGIGYRLSGEHVAHRGWDIDVGRVAIGKVEPFGGGHLGAVREGPLELGGRRGRGCGVRGGGGRLLLLDLQGKFLGETRALVVGEAGEEALSELVQETLLRLDRADGGDQVLFPVPRRTVVGVDVRGGRQLEIDHDRGVVREREEGKGRYVVGEAYGIAVGLWRSVSARDVH